METRAMRRWIECVASHSIHSQFDCATDDLFNARANERTAYEQAQTTETYKKMVRASVSYYAAAVAFGEILQTVSADVKEYVTEGVPDARPPESLARACALMESEHVTSAVAKVASALAHGAARGANARRVEESGEATTSGERAGAAPENLLESLVDVLLEPRRLRAVSDFVGSTSKSLMQSFVSVAKDNAEVLKTLTGYDAGERDASANPSMADRAATFLEEPRNRRAVIEIGREIADAATESYVRSMGEDNTYADLFNAIKSEENKRLFLEVMKAMVETSVRTYVVAGTEITIDPGSVLRSPRTSASEHVSVDKDDSPTSPLASRFDRASSLYTPDRTNGGEPQLNDGGHFDSEIHSPVMIGSWKELFAVATQSSENRRLFLATTGTATSAALRGFASGAYDLVFKGKFAGHRMHIQYWILAMVFAMSSVTLWVVLRILTFVAFGRLPT
jgi:hypothetical protein